MFKLILTSFRLALFSQVSFSVISFCTGVISSFQRASFHLASFRFIALHYLVYIYIYRKISVTTIVCVCDLSIDSKTIFCAIVLILIMTPTIKGKKISIYHWRNVGFKFFIKCISYTKRDWSVAAISFDPNSHVSCAV